MNDLYTYSQPALVWLFIVSQALYTFTFMLDLFFFSRPINWVDMKEVNELQEGDYPFIVLFFPVLRELETTMRTTLTSLAEIDYPKDRYRIISIPNSSDVDTIDSLRQLQQEFSFLEIMEVPPTTDPSWQPVWDSWDLNEKAYWWHLGQRAGNANLPPKKTRQLIYAFYNVAEQFKGKEDFLVNYLDADSCPPPDHFLAGAVGIRHYDVLQALNIAGNLNDTLASSRHAFDHMAWDGMKYAHLSANGKHPYWMLGKALFFKASDLIALGGFHPWIAIEDPEVGMRFWVNGKRLGIIEKPVIEETPTTMIGGILQRKRWVCGFFQSLGEPLTRLGMTRRQKILAWMNFLPCLMCSINSMGVPIGIWALWIYFFNETSILPLWTTGIAALNICAFFIILTCLYYNTWKRTALVLDNLPARIWYMLRVNPIFAMVWWFIWIIPLWMGFRMFLGEGGLVWDRTEKIDANAVLVRSKIDSTWE